jgi:metallo-beta-lactamase family protein
MPASLTFLGGAGEVTGSCALVEAEGVRFLVDCGLFQGGREAESRNRRRFAFDPSSIDFVLLSHAHIDHSGLLPRLAAAGFGGPVHATAATVDLAAVMLRDAAHIQQKEAEWAAKASGRSRRARAASWKARHASHHEAMSAHGDERARSGSEPPLYTMADAEAVIAQFERHPYAQAFRPHPAVEVTLHDAGHILGSAIVDIRLPGGARPHRLVFSGDLGQPGHPVVRDATTLEAADTLVVESTYGNRLHRSLDDTIEELVSVLEATLAHRRGNVVIPSFAVGRTQDLLVLLAQLARDSRLPPMDIYVDSPLATAATRITLEHLALLDEQAVALVRWLQSGGSGLRIHFSESVQDSMAINEQRGGAVIISASGMCDAGRIRHHLRHNLPRGECAVVFAGFQAQGTLGRRLVDGARSVRLFGEEIPVRASVHTIGGLSAHADQAALLAWLGGFTPPPGQTWVAHGEAGTAAVFAQALRDRLGWSGVDTAREGLQVALG